LLTMLAMLAMLADRPITEGLDHLPARQEVLR
jgi:hypothetical protein